MYTDSPLVRTQILVAGPLYIIAHILLFAVVILFGIIWFGLCALPYFIATGNDVGYKYERILDSIYESVIGF